MRTKTGRFRGKYDLFTFCLIPGTTLFLASLGDIWDTNLSVLGNQEGHQLLFALWGAGTGLYYCAYIRHLFRLGDYSEKKGRWMVGAAALCFFLAVVTPYLPERYPLRSRVHVALAFSSPFLLAFGLAGFLIQAGRRDRAAFRKAWNLLGLLGGTACFFLLKEGFISSALEVFVILSFCGFLRYMEKLLQQQ